MDRRHDLGSRLDRNRPRDLRLLAARAGARRSLSIRSSLEPCFHPAVATGPPTAGSLLLTAIPDDDRCAGAGLDGLGATTIGRPGGARRSLCSRRALEFFGGAGHGLAHRTRTVEQGNRLADV